MGIFDFFRKKSNSHELPEKNDLSSNSDCSGNAIAEKIHVTTSIIEKLQKSFIAFDVETTGLNPQTDRIVEIGAVLFSEGNPIKSFSTLVNPNIKISSSASAVNNITNAMLKSAPQEKEVYLKLIDFLDDALNGNTIMCAHNASFDFRFLCNTLSRLGFNANIRYVDTLSLARKYIKGLENYKQCTLENYFNLTNNASHRAGSDAENCGKILCNILKHINASPEKEKQHFIQNTPDKDELCVCAYIQSLIEKNGGDISYLRYRKDRSGYISIECLYSFLKFKFLKKGHYVIVDRDVLQHVELPTEPCIISEGGIAYSRVFFQSPFDLEPLAKYFFDSFSACYASMQEYICTSSNAKYNAEKSIRSAMKLSSDEVKKLLAYAESINFESTNVYSQSNQVVSRDNLQINAIHNRVPLSKIRNLNNWEKGFDDGYRYWEQSEVARKNSEFQNAIALLDKARYNGYCAPALYESYAKIYRSLKDYENEIVILEEAIERMTKLNYPTLKSSISILGARKNKAIALLFAQQSKATNESTRTAKKEIHSSRVNKSASQPKQPRGRSVIQMNDDGTIIEVYDTISAASRAVNVSSKSIRDAANGIQKHAGGFCWKYRD